MMTIPISKEEKNELLGAITDRLSYCEGYKEALIALNSQYNPHEKVNYRIGVTEPLFSLDQVLS